MPTVRSLALLLLAVPLLACARKTGGPVEPALDPPSTPAASPATQDVLSSPDAPSPLRAHRQQRPRIIGGCGESCKDGERAAGLFFAALQATDPVEAMRPLVELSVLVVDGEPKGERWSDLWSDGAMRPQREAEIDAWLREFTRWVPRVEDKGGIAAALARGVEIDRDIDVYQVRFRHPRLTPGLAEDARRDAEPIWSFRFRPRGHEWLLADVFHSDRGPIGKPTANRP